MRSVISVVIVLAISSASTAEAQRQGGHRGGAPSRPSPPVRTVAPPIVYPLPPLPTSPAGGLNSPRGFNDRAFRPQGPRGRQYPLSGYPFGLGGGYVESYAPDAPAAPFPPMAARPTGWLRLAVTPASAQVYVDTLYVGTVDDVNAKRELQLEAGPHRIEMRAQFYQPLVVDVLIAPNEAITYRGTLDTVRPVASAPQPSGGAANAAAKMYVISNCYIGNVPPRPSRLPAGCDVKQVRVVDQK
jgi:hypothetical protein